MRYAKIQTGPWRKLGFAGKLLSRVLPQANPDFESAYEKCDSWWLEIDEGNVVCREIAFDVSGKAVAAAPLGDNLGIFTDLDSAPEGLTLGVDAVRFESEWKEFESAWMASKGLSGRGDR